MFNLYFNKILRYYIYETRRGLDKKGLAAMLQALS